MHQKIDSKLAIGISRHKIKKELGHSPFIHSTGTADAYRQTTNEFSSWLKNENKEIWSTKNLDSITKDVAYRYLQERQENGLSAWTVTKDMSALNKILDLNLNKKEGGLQDRKLQDITRSRVSREHDKKYNPKNYMEQIEFSRAFGLRRESIYGGNYAVKESSLFTKDDNVFVRVIEKGGRYRESPCLRSYQNNIIEKYNIQSGESMTKEQFIESYYASKDSPLFDEYTSKIDNHAFRAEYAQDLYDEIASQKENIELDYKGYDSSILKDVSQALGHNRLSVVVNHYLY